MTQVRNFHVSSAGWYRRSSYVCFVSVVTNGRLLLGLPLGIWYDQCKITPSLLECDQHCAQRLWVPVTVLWSSRQADSQRLHWTSRILHSLTTSGHSTSCRAHVCYCEVRASSRHLQSPHSCVYLSDCSIRLLQPLWFRGPSVRYQYSSVRFYVLHQSIRQECREKSISTLL